MTTPEPGKSNSTQRVLDAVTALRHQEQIATRETVHVIVGGKMSVVDDRLRALVDDGKLKRLLRGVYELVEQFAPPRAMSGTIQDDGSVMLEIGDHVIKGLSPLEARRAARLLGGFAEDERVIENGRQHLFLATQLAATVEQQGREIKALQLALKQGPSPQMSLPV